MNSAGGDGGTEAFFLYNDALFSIEPAKFLKIV